MHSLHLQQGRPCTFLRLLRLAFRFRPLELLTYAHPSCRFRHVSVVSFVRFWRIGHSEYRNVRLFVRFSRIGHARHQNVRLDVRFSRIGHPESKHVFGCPILQNRTRKAPKRTFGCPFLQNRTSGIKTRVWLSYSAESDNLALEEGHGPWPLTHYERNVNKR